MIVDGVSLGRDSVPRQTFWMYIRVLTLEIVVLLEDHWGTDRPYVEVYPHSLRVSF